MTAAFELSSGSVRCGRKEGERVEKLDPFMYTLGRKKGTGVGTTLRMERLDLLDFSAHALGSKEFPRKQVQLDGHKSRESVSQSVASLR